jgi:hypothetical protein
MMRGSRTIRAVELELRAERETREAIIAAATAGADAVVLEAIASDPIPVDALNDGRSTQFEQRKRS